MSAAPLHDLVQSLDAALREPEPGGGKNVAGLLARYAQAHDDWRDYVHFREECYARNLVSASELFELLVICWQPGQVSPIHDHQGQRCWMGVLEGGISGIGRVDVHVDHVHAAGRPGRDADVGVGITTPPEVDGIGLSAGVLKAVGG